MILAISLNDLNKLKSRETAPLICHQCGSKFYQLVKNIKRAQKKIFQNECKFCSKKCYTDSKIKPGRKTTNCVNCGKEIVRSELNLSKFKNSFCSSSCNATYQNTHKTVGIKVSKLERWLQIKLQILYPTLDFKFNEKETINSELDIYIPSLKLAFELNGIFHYEPIYGQEKLASIQNNDNRKFQACLEQGIELVIIDVSGQKYFKETTSIKYLDIITHIIDIKLG